MNTGETTKTMLPKTYDWALLSTSRHTHTQTEQTFNGRFHTSTHPLLLLCLLLHCMDMSRPGAQVRLASVRAASIPSSALLEKKHRRPYELDPIDRPVSPPSKPRKSPSASPGAGRELQQQQQLQQASGQNQELKHEQQPNTDPLLSPPGTLTSTGAAVVAGSGSGAVYGSEADASGVVKSVPMKSAVWKLKTQEARPASREILHPEVAHYHGRLSKKRLSELNSRISEKVDAVVTTIKDEDTAALNRMNSLNVFHPSANARRAHARTLVKLSRRLDKSSIEHAVLQEMIMDDKRSLSSEEVEMLELQFGRMFQGTALQNVLKAREEEKESPRVELERQLGSRGNDNSDDPTSLTKPIGELNNQKLLSYDEFKASSRPTTSGATPSGNDEGFKDFAYMRTLASRSSTTRQQDKEPLAFNTAGAYSGILAGGKPVAMNKVGGDIEERPWTDSERVGKRPSYKERHEKVIGFEHMYGSANVAAASVTDPVSDPAEAIFDSSSIVRDDVIGGDDELQIEEKKGDFTASEDTRPKANKLRRRSKQKSSHDQLSSTNTTVSNALLLQSRIERCWSVLEVPMIKKLQFLQKFSDSAFSASLPRAVELFELASNVVPLREIVVRKLVEAKWGPSRMSPADLLNDLVGLDDLNLGLPDLPESFYFEKKVEDGNLTDEELLLVSESFDDSKGGGAVTFPEDIVHWLEKVVERLDDFIKDLSKTLKNELGEQIVYKSLAYELRPPAEPRKKETQDGKE